MARFYFDQSKCGLFSLGACKVRSAQNHHHFFFSFAFTEGGALVGTGGSLRAVARIG